MAEILNAGSGGNRRLASRLRIDLTPMVDLGFLLITFFVYTASLAEDKALKLFMPADGPASSLPRSAAVSVLMDENDKLYYYEGDWQQALEENRVIATNYSQVNGVGQLIRKKQAAMGPRRQEMMLLIKPGDGASYTNIINMLDEATINGITKYAIVDAGTEERVFLERK